MVKILFLVVSMTVLMLIIAWVGYSTSTRITLRMQDIFRNEVLSALNMTDAKALALENRLLVLSMMYTSSDAETEEYAKHFSENRAVVVKYAGELDPTRLEPEVRTLHTNLVALGQEYRKKQDEAVSAAKNGVQMDKIEARLLGDGDIAQMEDRYVDGLEKLSGALVKTAYSVNEAAADFARGRAVSIAATAFVAILIGLLLSVLISRMITSPIRGIMESVKVFATGDLVGGFPTRGKDELALMGQSLQGMSENLTRIIVSVKNASAQILDASQEFSALAQETSASIQESRANVDETGSNLMSLAAAGEEVNASVEEVAAGAQATAQKGTDIATRVEEAMKAGNDGMTSVKSVVSGIDGVVSNASSTVKSVQELSARSQKLHLFVSQIGELADMTKLLARYAAHEA
ncbi:MAG: methyl-accepting chemotaxis protein, partial [Synergistaceae bacterium]|nr:methyl-accepting chemotaxis protein [Synergistaceae bacterium]